MPFKSGYGAGSQEIRVAVGIGVGVAAVAGIAAGAAFGSGLLPASPLTKRRKAPKAPLKEEDIVWDEDGRICNWSTVVKIVQQGGVSTTLRPLIWPLLLGVHSPLSTAAERTVELNRLRKTYTKLVLVCQELDKQIEKVKKAHATQMSEKIQNSRHSSLPPSPEKPPKLPGNLATFAEAHRIIVMDAVRTDISRTTEASRDETYYEQHRSVRGPVSKVDKNNKNHNGIVTQSPRKEALTVLPVSVSEGLPELMLEDPPVLEPASAVANGEVPLWRSALATSTIGSAQHVPPATRRLMLRLVNLLSAYSIHDPETGYCQGMSDLAVAFVQFIGDDALAFACFELLMRVARQNFRHDESGILLQLSKIGRVVADTDPVLYNRLQQLGVADCMFAYRMVIVMLRRELSLQETLVLWEVSWSLSKDSVMWRQHTYQSGASQKEQREQSQADFILQFIAAVIRSQRSNIMSGDVKDSDDVLRLFNAVDIDFWTVLAQARKQYKAYSSPLLDYIQKQA